jgi:cytochrome b involved in lipid metabolism
MSLYTVEEVAKHNTEKDCWVIIGGEVYNVTKFLPEHPGGARAILLFAGKDATDEFDMLHERRVIQKYAPTAHIGKIAGDNKSKL